MNKKKIAVIILISLILAALVGTGIFLKSSGKLPFGKEGKSETEKVITDDNLGKIKNEVPFSPMAAKITADDYSSDNDIKSFKKSGFNTFIIQYDSLQSDKIKTISDKFNDYGIYHGIRISQKDSESFFKTFAYVNTDFVIFADMNDSGEYFVSDTMDINKKVKEIDPLCQFGIEADDSSVISDYLLASAGAKYIDFILVCQKESPLNEFTSTLGKWYEVSAEIWVEYNLTSIDNSEQENAAEIITAINSLDSSLCKTVCINDYKSVMLSTSEASESIRKFIKSHDNNLESKEFEIINYAGTDITVSSPKINFRGTCSPLSELKCNGKKVITAANGDFSVDCDINSGQNKIVFEHKGHVYNYNVTYNVDIIKSVSPSTALVIPGGMEFEISAVALTGSSVSVLFNGRTFNMSKDNEKYDEETPEGNYSTYKVTFTSPSETSKEQNLGNFKVNATYKGISQSKTGAIIKVSSYSKIYNPVIPSVTPETELITPETQIIQTESVPEVSTSQRRGMTTTKRNTTAKRSVTTSGGGHTEAQTDTLQKYSYLSNYGLGAAKLVEIIDDYVEVYPGNNLKTNSEPECSPFLKGTVDYCHTTASIDSDTYYFMNSGYKVPSTRTDNETGGKSTVSQAKLVDGYIMPSNNIKIISSQTVNNKTIIRLSMNRKVPFNACLTGQSYANNGSGRMVSVNQVNCSGIRFTFYDTVSIYGSLNFAGNILSSGSTSKGEGFCTLNLTFLKPGKFYGYHCEYDSEGNLVISIKEKPASISEYTVMIDPGHGGRDPGALCAVSSATWNEASINLSIAEKIKSELEASGASVILTRSDNSFLSLADRNRMVRCYQPDLFISVHCNASGSESSYGVCSFYYRAYSQPLSKCIQDNLVNAYTNYIYAGKNLTGINRGSQFGAYRVTRVEECPSVLVEYGFVTSVMESQVLQNTSSRNILAKATADGIKSYITYY